MNAASAPQTRWPHDVAHVFGGMFFTNALPHFINGISGNPFQSPFAHPPGEGLSSSLVNVVWGLANFVVAYLLLVRPRRIDLRVTRHLLAFAAGSTAIALQLAYHFGRFHGGLL